MRCVMPTLLNFTLGIASSNCSASGPLECTDLHLFVNAILFQKVIKTAPRMGIHFSCLGLVVEDAAGPAAMAGIQPGDLLMAINGKPVTRINQVREMVAKSDKSWALLIQRDGNKIFVPVRIG